MKTSSIRILVFSISIFFLAIYKFCCVRTIHAEVPIFKINLDLAPEKRWDSIIEKLPSSMLIQCAQHIDLMLNRAKFKVAPQLHELMKSPLLPEEYKKELIGISQSL